MVYCLFCLSASLNRRNHLSIPHCIIMSTFPTPSSEHEFLASRSQCAIASPCCQGIRHFAPPPPSISQRAIWSGQVWFASPPVRYQGLMRYVDKVDGIPSARDCSLGYGIYMAFLCERQNSARYCTQSRSIGTPQSSQSICSADCLDDARN